MNKYKFNIFDVLKEIQSKNIEFFDNLEDYEVKQLSPYVLMKWMSGSKDKNQIVLLNEILNSKVFRLYNNQKLAYKLLIAISTNKDKNFKWIKRPKNKSHNLILKLIHEYYNCSATEATLYYNTCTKDEIMDMAESLGYDKETVKKIKKELNE